MPLEEFLPAQVYAFLIVLARTGSMLVLMPGIGEGYIQIRIRLFFGLAFALAVTPIVAPFLPPEPESIPGLFAMVFGEVVIGLYFGLVGRILLLTMDTLGRIVSFQIGLAAAQIFNPTISEQGTLVGLFLTTLGILFLFIFDLHHVLLRAIVDSFTLFQPGVVPPFDDLAEALGRVTADSFKIAVQFSAPFLVLGLIFYTCLGILARLMPQLQIFFIGIPVQLLMGLAALFVILSGLMGLFVEYYATNVDEYLLPR